MANNAPNTPGEKRGSLLLVGFGPGSEEHLTHRARWAIEHAEIIIGYRTYIDLVRPLIQNKTIIQTGMTEEIERASQAVDLAFSGKTVALVSSGDVGIYGMAGLAYEVLADRGYTGSEIDVEVIPGVTALSACASILGAPLMHDFASISLSDLLTPWEVITKRLKAAAEADFVIALYNPKSSKRVRQIEEAREIMMEVRDHNTPVGIVKSAMREGENIVISTLSDMLTHPIGMLTTILVGNSQTRIIAGKMVTPRGYQKKYNIHTGDRLTKSKTL
ncbi:MAG: precorrin-3B C(17)-methyltransferase [Leptospirillum sp.]|jgi:precorrin-3B C17-methyltransferase